MDAEVWLQVIALLAGAAASLFNVRLRSLLRAVFRHPSTTSVVREDADGTISITDQVNVTDEVQTELVHGDDSPDESEGGPRG